MSPAIADFYSLPQEGDWVPWDKVELYPALLKTEPFEESVLPSVPQRTMSLSPAINPMDLTNPLSDEPLFGHEGINDNQPLFQTQFPLAPARPQPTRVQHQQQQQQQQQSMRPSAGKKPTQPAAQPATKRYPRGNLKRKCSASEDDDELSRRSSASPPPSTRRRKGSEDGAGPKKSAHNMIEKRYRNNLNDKIAALRDSVPALRVMVHRLESGQTGSEAGDEEGCGVDHRQQHLLSTDDLGGLTPAHKLNKATILCKATEYILHLERKNRSLARENAALRSRMEGFEMLVMDRGGPDEGWN